VILHGVLLSRPPGRKATIIFAFCHQEKKNARQYGQKATGRQSDRLQLLNADLPGFNGA
jgi:hypothetical protein